MRPFMLPWSLAAFILALNGPVAAKAPIAALTPAASSIADCRPGGPCDHPLKVKVVIVSLFEIGKDEGDIAGEFQLWKQRRKLTQRIPFPQSFHDLYYNPDTQVLGMVTGVGTARSTGSESGS